MTLTLEAFAKAKGRRLVLLKAGNHNLIASIATSELGWRNRLAPWLRSRRASHHQTPLDHQGSPHNHYESRGLSVAQTGAFHAQHQGDRAFKKAFVAALHSHYDCEVISLAFQRAGVRLEEGAYSAPMGERQVRAILRSAAREHLARRPSGHPEVDRTNPGHGHGIIQRPMPAWRGLLARLRNGTSADFASDLSRLHETFPGLAAYAAEAFLGSPAIRDASLFCANLARQISVGDGGWHSEPSAFRAAASDCLRAFDFSTVWSDLDIEQLNPTKSDGIFVDRPGRQDADSHFSASDCPASDLPSFSRKELTSVWTNYVTFLSAQELALETIVPTSVQGRSLKRAILTDISLQKTRWRDENTTAAPAM